MRVNLVEVYLAAPETTMVVLVEVHLAAPDRTRVGPLEVHLAAVMRRVALMVVGERRSLLPVKLDMGVVYQMTTEMKKQCVQLLQEVCLYLHFEDDPT